MHCKLQFCLSLKVQRRVIRLMLADSFELVRFPSLQSSFERRFIDHSLVLQFINLQIHRSLHWRGFSAQQLDKIQLQWASVLCRIKMIGPNTCENILIVQKIHQQRSNDALCLKIYLMKA